MDMRYINEFFKLKQLSFITNACSRCNYLCTMDYSDDNLEIEFSFYQGPTQIEGWLDMECIDSFLI